MRGLSEKVLTIIFCWIGIIALLLILFISSVLNGNPATPNSNGITQPFTETELNAFLRHTVQVGGERVPFAVLLTAEVMRGEKRNIEYAVEQFFQDKSPYHFILYVGSLPDPGYADPPQLWLESGSRSVDGTHGVNLATKKLPLPDGSFIFIKYFEVPS